MKNNKGFTLTEVLVAFAIMVIGIMCFLPFMLSSLKNIQVSGEYDKTTIAEKSDVEEQLSAGLNISGESNASINFVQGTTKPDTIYIDGEYKVSTQEKISTYLAETTGSISISPTTISEICKNGTKITITSDLIEFKDVTKFKLVANGGDINAAAVNGVNTLYKFRVDSSNVNKATLEILNNDFLSISNGPYKIYYNGSGATLSVTPPSIIALGAGGTYFARTVGAAPTENTVWVQGKYKTTPTSTMVKGKLGSKTFNDAIWTGTQYIAGGDDGNWFYTNEDNTTGWQPNPSNQLGSETYILDLYYSDFFGKTISTGYRKYRVLLVKWDNAYYQALTSPGEAQFNSNTTDSYTWGHTRGVSVTEGYDINNKPAILQIKRSGSTYTSYFKNETSTYGAKTIDSIGESIISISGNGKQGYDNEYMLATTNKGIYSYKPNTTGSWYTADDVLESSNYVSQGTVYYYIIKSYNSAHALPEDYQYVSATRLPDPQPLEGGANNEYYIKLKNPDGTEGYYKMTNAGSDVNIDRVQKVTGKIYTGSVQGAVVRTGEDVNALTYAEDMFVMGGKNITVQEFKPNSVISSVTVNRRDTGKWAGNSWNYNANVTPIISSGTMPGITSGKIAYRVDDVWKISPLPGTVPASTIIYEIAYIGDRFYAVGSNSVILSISPQDLKDGKAWTKEAVSQNGLTFTSIAGWGIE